MTTSNLLLTRRAFLAESAICAIAAGSVLAGCSTSSNNNSGGNDSAQNKTTKDNQQSKEASIDEKLIGVWQNSKNYIAFDGKTLLSLSEAVSSASDAICSPYTIEDNSVKITDSDKSISISSLSNDSVTLSGEIQGTFSKTADNPSDFIASNYVVLKPGDTWENESISVLIDQAVYADDNGFSTVKGSVYPTKTNQYVVEMTVLNLTEDTISGNGRFFMNGSATKSITLSGAAYGLGALQEDSALFSYEVSPQLKDRVNNLTLQFRYKTTTGDNGSYITPVLVVAVV